MAGNLRTDVVLGTCSWCLCEAGDHATQGSMETGTAFRAMYWSLRLATKHMQQCIEGYLLYGTASSPCRHAGGCEHDSRAAPDLRPSTASGSLASEASPITTACNSNHTMRTVAAPSRLQQGVYPASCRDRLCVPAMYTCCRCRPLHRHCCCCLRQPSAHNACARQPLLCKRPKCTAAMRATCCLQAGTC